MDEEYRAILQRFVKALQPNLFEEDFLRMSEELKVVGYPAGTLLVRQGGQAPDCYFVLQGCLRTFYQTDDGEEHTSGFFFEGESLTILESYRFQKPSPWSIDCVEASVVIQGSSDDEEAFRTRHEGLTPLLQRSLEEDLKNHQWQQARLRAQSPEERYLSFLKERPGHAARIPQHQLASFLGIRPESLSRIKRRLHRAG